MASNLSCRTGRLTVMEKKVIIFDFDGTLADTLASIITIGNQLADEYGYKKISNEEIGELRNKTIYQIIEKFHIPIFKMPFLLAKAKSLLHTYMETVHPFQGIGELLLNLRKKGGKLGILTSNSKINVEKFLSVHNLQVFDFIHSEFNIFGKEKAIKHIIHTYHFSLKEVIYVGDEVRDIEACKKSNIDMIAVTWGFNTKELLEKNNPTYLVNTTEELSQLLSE